MEAKIVPADFHARFSARGKTYIYRIVNGPVCSPFWFRYAHHEARILDLNNMRQGARLFLGDHRFTNNSTAQADAESRVRTITRCGVAERYEERARSRMVEISMSANGFLRYMVRSIAGTLLAVGRGEMETEEVAGAIDSGNRSLVAATAPACGLTLLSVDYLSSAWFFVLSSWKLN